MRILLFMCYFLLFNTLLSSQQSPALSLLEESINYHDPSHKWATFTTNLKFVQPRPNAPDTTIREISFNLEKETFSFKQVGDGYTIERLLNKKDCFNKYNGSTNFSEEIKEKYRLDCDRAAMYRDYYTYLYGLPMKLRDPGTRIAPNIIETEFQGVQCNAIKVTYDPVVGKDIWYFYFEPTTSALIGYRFYHNETKNDGEYITLSGIVNINGILMPKDRNWYMNENDQFLGSDLMVPFDDNQ